MSEESSNQAEIPSVDDAVHGRRLFLQSMGKWSGAAIVAAVVGSWLAGAPQARAGVWINRRGVGGGGWVNRGGGGSWLNRGGGWLNRGGGWVNRRGGGGSWINRF